MKFISMGGPQAGVASLPACFQVCATYPLNLISDIKCVYSNILEPSNLWSIRSQLLFLFFSFPFFLLIFLYNFLEKIVLIFDFLWVCRMTSYAIYMHNWWSSEYTQIMFRFCFCFVYFLCVCVCFFLGS